MDGGLWRGCDSRGPEGSVTGIGYLSCWTRAGGNV